MIACLTTAGARADDQGGSLHVAGFDLPRYSDFLSQETRTGIERLTALYAQGRQLCNPMTKTTGPEIRACETLMYQPILAEARKLYDVSIQPAKIGGVQTDVVAPAAGVPESNRFRVLLNVHGGSFKYGARFGGQLEAMPMAALGGYKVVAVDYRMSPEHQYPAATLDVVAVYRELLKEYPPDGIGLYGCSAGGRIVGQALAWIIRHKLPNPGAVGILCSPPTRFGGDSNAIAAALQGTPALVRKFDEGYFKGADPNDPLVFPGDFDEMLARFPPTLLMTSTRDYSLSPMVNMHSRLVRLGVQADLHVFEGLHHSQFLNMYIPESRWAASALSAFFDRTLARRAPHTQSRQLGGGSAHRRTDPASPLHTSE